ncbi:MAG: bifunctional nuclease family protein [Chitinophagales bacterium]|nr:bifunctional nuclease family protein [Chitinophagaceae bacterium]MBP9884240.1 bifunctional nuclease family protein [Chitinophagales bacterium]
MKKIELEIVALSHSITQSHSYAVVLGEVSGIRRLPIVIGGFEAQAIAVALEKMNPTRPLTHDLMKSICHSFNIEVKEVIINNLLDGIFYSQLVCKHGNELIEVDSRTSDALALAVRFDCPIYTYEFILDSAGLILEEPAKEEKLEIKERKSEKKSGTATAVKSMDLTSQSLPELNQLLQTLLEKEDYEQAIRVRDEISRRKNQS